jgi:hypothetical protein
MTGKGKNRVQVLVAVNDEHLSKISQIAQQCKKAGLKVDKTLEGVGIITGSISEDKLDSLTGVDGVASVEREQAYQIPPPDSDVQ